jgi:DNA (cytosine-5)-methyltransferase 1
LIAKDFDIKSANAQILAPSLEFYHLVKKSGDELPFGHLDYFDATKSNHHKLFEESFLSTLVNGEKVTVRDALDDLKKNHPSEPSEIIKASNTTFESLPQRNSLSNNDYRNNGEVVQRRFRLYQVLQIIDDRKITTAVFTVLKGNATELSDDVWSVCKKVRLPTS